MLLPHFSLSARLTVFFGIILGLGFPLLSTQAIHLSKVNLHQVNPLLSPNSMIQQSFDPPGAPVPSSTRGAGSRGIIYQPTFPEM